MIIIVQTTKKFNNCDLNDYYRFFVHTLWMMNLLAQKHDKVTCATKQIEQDSKDTDATNSCPRKVQIK